MRLDFTQCSASSHRPRILFDASHAVRAVPSLKTARRRPGLSHTVLISPLCRLSGGAAFAQCHIFPFWLTRSPALRRSGVSQVSRKRQTCRARWRHANITSKHLSMSVHPAREGSATPAGCPHTLGTRARDDALTLAANSWWIPHSGQTSEMFPFELCSIRSAGFVDVDLGRDDALCLDCRAPTRANLVPPSPTKGIVFSFLFCSLLSFVQHLRHSRPSTSFINSSLSSIHQPASSPDPSLPFQHPQTHIHHTMARTKQTTSRAKPTPADLTIFPNNKKLWKPEDVSRLPRMALGGRNAQPLCRPHLPTLCRLLIQSTPGPLPHRAARPRGEIRRHQTLPHRHEHAPEDLQDRKSRGESVRAPNGSGIRRGHLSGGV